MAPPYMVQLFTLATFAVISDAISPFDGCEGVNQTRMFRSTGEERYTQNIISLLIQSFTSV